MALEIFRLVGSVFVDTDAAEKSLKKTDKSAEGFGTKLINAGKKAGQFGLAVGAAAVAAGAAMVAVTESTREYRTEQGKLQTAFETQKFSADQARKTYEELNGVLGDSGQAVEAANHLAQLADNEKDLQKWTDICTGVFATFGDSLPIEGLTEAANETAKTGALTGGLADALNWAGVSEEEFQKKLDKCNTEQERAALITDTMNGLYSESAEKYKEVSKDVIAANKAQDRLNKTMADVGGALEPFVTKGKELVADFLEKATPYIENLADKALPWLSDRFEDLEGVMEQVSDGIEWAVDKFGEFTDWCAEHQGTIETVAIVIGSFAAAWGLVNAAVGIWTGVATVATGATTALSTAIAILTSPITLVIAAIGAVIAIGVLLWKNWDKIKAKCKELWKYVVERFNKIKQDVSKKVEEMKKAIADKFNKIKTDAVKKIEDTRKAAVDKFNEIKTKISKAAEEAKSKVTSYFSSMKKNIEDYCSTAYSKAKSNFENMKTAISNAASSAKSTVSSYFSEIASNVLTYAGEAYTSANDKFNSIKTSISNAVSEAYSSVSSWFSSIKSTISDYVSSAYSSVSDKFGSIKSSISDAVSGAYTSVKDTFTNIYNTVKEKIDSAKTAIKKAVDKIKEYFDFKLKLDITWPKIKVSGGQAPWGLAGEGYPPSIDITWHKKAMDNAMILDNPTIFGYGNGSFLGGGEAGNEVIAGEAHLLDLIGKVVSAKTAEQNGQIVALLAALVDATEGGNRDIIRALLAGQKIVINERELARVVRAYA